jgi:protein-tyrosine phosphatase
MAEGYVDLHCHWIPNIDDGARSVEDGVRMLGELAALGFETVMATPHMRPGLFDNTRIDLENAYADMEPVVAANPDLPRTALSGEHYLDDVVFQRLLAGSGLPYPGGRAVLVELSPAEYPSLLDYRLVDLRRHGLVPVIAHPERYRYIWRSPEKLQQLIRAGAATLLDIGALEGAYGREPRRCAEKLLELGLYHAACSDAHCVADIDHVTAGLEAIERRYGQEEVDYLFRTGPLALLEGEVPEL